MSVAFKQAIANIKELSMDEKALMAHCLISSLESKQDIGADDAWSILAEKRFLELESGTVKAASWKEMKSVIKG